MRKLFMSGLLLTFVLGCGVPYQGTLYTNSILYHIYTPKIINGKTTEQEIRQWFGDPWQVSTNAYGRTQFTYLFGRGQRRLDVDFKDGVVYTHDTIWYGGDGTDREDILRRP